MKNRPRELGRLPACLRSTEHVSKVTIRQQVGSSHKIFTNESSRHQGLDLPAPVQPAEACSSEHSDLSALDEDSRYQRLDLPAAVQLDEASSSEHSNLSDLDEDFLSPSTWINKQKQTEEEVWSEFYLHHMQISLSPLMSSAYYIVSSRYKGHFCRRVSPEGFIFC